jgi:hypothetical protein
MVSAVMPVPSEMKNTGRAMRIPRWKEAAFCRSGDGFGLAGPRPTTDNARLGTRRPLPRSPH